MSQSAEEALKDAPENLTEEAPRKRRAKTSSRGQRGNAPAEELSPLFSEVYGILLIVLSAILLLALASYDPSDLDPASSSRTSNWIGPVGAYVARAFLASVGLVAFPVVVSFGLIGIGFLRGRMLPLSGISLLAFACVLISKSALLQLIAGPTRILGAPAGGNLGLYIGEAAQALLSTAGTALIFTALLLVSAAVLTRRTPRELGRAFVAACRRLGATLINMARRSESATLDESSEPREAGVESALGPVPVIKKPPKVAPRPSVDLVEEQEPRANSEEPPAHSETSETLDAPSDLKRNETSKVAGHDEDQGPRIIQSEAMTRRVSAEALTAPAVPREEEADYILPDLSLLDYHPPPDREINADALRENALVLEQKLADFNVQGTVVEIHPGPVVTTYEFQPAAGIKISRIQNLSDDLTMALAAQRVRIIAPIPGKAVVGIEVPNKEREIVYLREVLADIRFRKAKSKLTVALGKDIVGRSTVADLGKAPHLLVAGSTGSGKSVAINAFILSLLYRSHPDEVRLIMVDPKMLELTVYQGIPHLLLPVVTDPKDAAQALKWAVMEMERRYRLMSKFGVRNITGYNLKIDQLRRHLDGGEDSSAGATPEEEELLARLAAQEKPPGTQPELEFEANDSEHLAKMPYIVVIVDELADLMMVASKEVETSIARLAQMARAAGIHLILATQRPSVDVITGLIKANFPTRMSFQVASKIDARTVLDQKGAEALLGMGDMLFLPPGTSRLERNHGAFVSDDEVRRVADFIKQQRSPDYQMDILAGADDTESDEGSPQEYDELYDQAVAIVAESRQASISYLQRRLKVGYNRAARMIECMEQEGVVGPSDGPKPREIFVSPM